MDVATPQFMNEGEPAKATSPAEELEHGAEQLASTVGKARSRVRRQSRDVRRTLVAGALVLTAALGAVALGRSLAARLREQGRPAARVRWRARRATRRVQGMFGQFNLARPSADELHDEARPEQIAVASGSFGVPRPSLAPYVTGTGATRGACTCAYCASRS